MEYGLIGNPLGHSYSKIVHGFIGDYDYAITPILPENLDAFMKAKDFKGINVTIRYKKDVIFTITTGKVPSDDRTLIVVGGQSGAGKSRLIPVAKQELQKNAVVVDFDELRSLHPHYEEVNSKYTEMRIVDNSLTSYVSISSDISGTNEIINY